MVIKKLVNPEPRGNRTRYDEAKCEIRRTFAGRPQVSWGVDPKTGSFIVSEVGEELNERSRWSEFLVRQQLASFDCSTLQGPFAGSNRLPPGHRLVKDSSGRLDILPSKRELEECIHDPKLATSLLESLLLHECSEIPEGATVLTSGGVDSPLLLSMLHRCGKRPKSLTIVSRFPSQNEEVIVRRLCARLGVECETYSIDNLNPFKDPMPAWTQARHYGPGLFPDISFLTDMLTQLSRNGTSHVVSGVGADQLFLINHHRALMEAVSSLDPELAAAALEYVSPRELPGLLLSQSAGWRRLRTKPSWTHPETLLKGNVRQEFPGVFGGWRYEMVTRALSALEEFAGVTISTPYLSDSLVLLRGRIAPEILLKQGETKALLRRVAQSYLPHEMAWRGKGGVFTDYWLACLRELGLEAIVQRLQPLQGYLKPEAYSQTLIRDALFPEMESDGRGCYSIANAIVIADGLKELIRNE